MSYLLNIESFFIRLKKEYLNR